MTERKYENMHVGDELPISCYELTEERAREFAVAAEEDRPWYQDLPFEGQIVPPLIVCDDHILPLLSSGYSTLGIHVKAEYELLHPIRLGAVLTVRGKIANLYTRGGRNYVVIETTTTDERGREVARSRQVAIEAAATGGAV